ncbi:LysE family translocator [Thermopolyspora sp. NPDC052614]|uniref:LysE family translocator n=1 Tax=Thermopolyspora sp. NPDC052614 TaxID=3155682 RepID=UPI0034350580
MNWSSYGAFLAFATVLALIPGPDFAVVTKNTLAGGRRRGVWCSAGVSLSAALQGGAAATGLGILITQVQPVFQAVKWAGVLYLVYLGVQTLRSAVRGYYRPITGDGTAAAARGGWREGFLSNITNPKVLMFYLAVLPQFITPDAGLFVLLLFALSHAVLALICLLVVVAILDRVRVVLSRHAVRRALDAVIGTALLGFGARLATEGT